MNRLLCACLLLCVFGINTYAETRLSGVGVREGHRRKRSESTERMLGCCGLPGRDGRDGRDGIQGPYGAPGPQGEMGPPGDSTVNNLDKIVDDLTAKFSAVLNKYTGDKPDKKSDQPGVTFTEQLTAEKSDRTNLGGAVYTRWGRKVCPNHSDMLYTGVMAGSHYKQKGNGANHLCLPLNPQWNNTHAGHQSFTYLHGTEIELYPGNPVFHKSNSGGSSQHNRDALCAVCYTPGRPSHVMIPARLECPIGWTVEYLGFMMAAHNTHEKTEYVCVDQDPDTHPGTAENVNGHLLYIVEMVCGPLPCPEYVDGYEVTCVVCTK